ncbi:MAG: hypothetical protein ACOX87_10105 [Chloroflexota bacterium]
MGGISIRVFGREEPILFAANELARYLPRLLPGAELDIFVGHPEQTLAAAGFPQERALADGSILVRGDGRRYAVAGSDPAATLHAAYAFLEVLGARWVKPGPDGEAMRPLDVPPPPLQITSTPAFSRRGLTDGCLSWWPGSASFQDWLDEMVQLVDWMGKMRLNRLFVHFNRLPPGDISPLLPELERRGIALELGGHCLPKLLPPALRESEPSICRMQNGVRRADGNFCTANPRTLRLLEEGARRFAEQLPSADLYHLWPCDASEEPWCSCPDCRSLSGDQQLWRAVQAAAEGLYAVRPDARVSGLLYHESLQAVESAPSNLELLFAPRERCYLHHIDGDCPRNQGYLRDLTGAVAARGGDLTVLEYYGDPVLFGRPANLPQLVESDLAAYRAAGVDSVSTLVFGTLSWWLYPLQLYSFAREAWEGDGAEGHPRGQPPSCLDDYCGVVGGEVARDQLARYYRLGEEAAGGHFRFCGYGADGSWATLPFPPGQPSMEVREHLADLRAGQDRLAAAGRLLERMDSLHDGRLRDILSAYRFESSFHRAVVKEFARLTGNWEGDPRRAFGRALEAVEDASPEALGVFGRHWMLPWLRRCVEQGCKAPM